MSNTPLIKDPEPQVTTSMVVNQVVLQGIADYLGVGVDLATQWSSTSIVLAQIKQRLEVIQGGNSTAILKFWHKTGPRSEVTSVLEQYKFGQASKLQT